jgi:hypothetical protein
MFHIMQFLNQFRVTLWNMPWDLCLYILQIEALFDLIKGLIKDMDGAQDDEVRSCTSSYNWFVIFFVLPPDYNFSSSLSPLLTCCLH